MDQATKDRIQREIEEEIKTLFADSVRRVPTPAEPIL